MVVSINGGTPKWMVFVRENPINTDDLGVPPFQVTSIYSYGKCTFSSMNDLLQKN